MKVRIIDRGERVSILGAEEDVRMSHALLSGLLANVRKGHAPNLHEVTSLIDAHKRQEEEDSDGWQTECPKALRRDIHIRPRTRGQETYLSTIASKEMTFVIGPAGTGKTYLAMAAAVSALLNQKVQRLILTRPAVEAGENLGFLPGDLEQKVDPYLRPLYDALYSMVEVDKVRRFIDRQLIEVAPLAFMRGRTLDKAFVILDEAQNTTTEQMKMFLTRLGQGSHAVITGDVTQRDLPSGVKSGLVEATRILENVPDIGIVHLTKRDVVRNPLVQKIVDAYEDESDHVSAAMAAGIHPIGPAESGTC